jgi:predicted component of type VI protein secretion system
MQSCQKIRKYDTDAANANARLSSQMQYIMATSRFAHYMKAIMRDKIGSFMERSDCEGFLNRWISNYVLASDTGTQADKAKYFCAPIFSSTSCQHRSGWWRICRRRPRGSERCWSGA